MSEIPKYLRLVASNDAPVLRERKVFWWRKMPIFRVLQVPLGIVTIIVFVSGTFLFSLKQWEAASTLLMFAFVCMFLFWALEFALKKEFDLYKTED